MIVHLQSFSYLGSFLHLPVGLSCLSTRPSVPVFQFSLRPPLIGDLNVLLPRTGGGVLLPTRTDSLGSFLPATTPVLHTDWLGLRDVDTPDATILSEGSVDLSRDRTNRPSVSRDYWDLD